MKYLITFFIHIFLSCSLLYAQESDNRNIIQQLEGFELSDKQSLRDYYEISSKALNTSFGQFNKKYLKRGLHRAQKIEADSLIANFSQILTHSYIISDYNLDSILLYGNMQIEVSKKINAFQIIATGHEYIGIAYLNNENHNLALDHFTKSYEVLKEKGEPYNANNVLGSIASIYNDLGDIPNAIKYTNLALYHLKQSPYYTENSPGFLYFQLAYLYNKQNQLDSSEFYRIKNLNLIRRIGEPDEFNHKHFFLWSYVFSGQYFIEIDQLDSVQYFLNAAKPFREFEPFTYDELQFKYCLKTGSCENLKEQLRAMEDYEPSLTPLHRQKYLGLKRDYFKSIGDFQSALKTTDSIQILQEERLTKERNNYAVFMDAKFENSANEQKIEQLEIDNQLRKSRLQLLTLGFIFSLLVLGFAIFIYFQTRKNLVSSRLIEKQTKRLQLAESQKNTFLNNVAHELQTPLIIIKGLSKQLLTYPNSVHLKEPLQIIIRNTSYLSNAVQKMMSTNQPADNELNLFALADFFQFLIPEYHFLTNQKEIIFITPTLESLPNAIIYSDFSKLSAILKNLLYNAIKFTQEGGQVELTYQDELQFHLFKIKDNGRGMTPAEQSIIFERYAQLDDHHTKGGFGLGLAICKAYIDALDGELSVTSELGKGSTFTVKIPKVAKMQLKKLSEEQPLHKFPKIELAAPIKIGTNQIPKETHTQLLIVEDNLDFCKYLETILAQNYNLSFVHSGTEALKYLTDHQPSLIITDWMMEGMDGLKLVEQLKKSDNWIIPIILLTARSLISDQLKALSLGVNEYLVKPIDEKILLSKIKHLLATSDNKQNISSFTMFQYTKKKTLQLSKKEQDWLLEAENIIQLNIQNFEFRLIDLANDMQISLSSLNNKIKSMTGLTSSNFIQEVRYWEARRLLEENEIKSVKVLSLTVGFKDVKNFSRNFKKRFGKYPTEYIEDTT